MGPLMKLAAFDLEIASEFQEDEKGNIDKSKLGITCAAIAYSDRDKVWFKSGIPRLTKPESRELVSRLIQAHENGYRILTWNGCGFDFEVLAHESGMLEECGRLALNHIDLMLMVTFTKGWYLGLQTALEGAGLDGKLKRVTLSDGSIIEAMDGSKAPALWASGEYDAVLAYLKQDVVQLLDLADAILANRGISWTSNNGNPMFVPFEGLLTVGQCFQIPEPDTSWMKNPPTRLQFVQWFIK
jgi:hypothetical protein